VGSDVGFHVGKNFLESFPDRVYISQLIPIMNQLKRLGEKTGKGFYKVCVFQEYSFLNGQHAIWAFPHCLCRVSAMRCKGSLYH